MSREPIRENPECDTCGQWLDSEEEWRESVLKLHAAEAERDALRAALERALEAFHWEHPQPTGTPEDFRECAQCSRLAEPAAPQEGTT